MSVVATQVAGGICAISLRGELSDAESAALRTMLVTALWRERHTQVVVDIAHDAVVDATTVGCLLAATNIAKDQHVPLRLQCGNPETIRQLATAGLETVVN